MPYKGVGNGTLKKTPRANPDVGPFLQSLFERSHAPKSIRNLENFCWKKAILKNLLWMKIKAREVCARSTLREQPVMDGVIGMSCLTRAWARREITHPSQESEPSCGKDAMITCRQLTYRRPLKLRREEEGKAPAQPTFIFTDISLCFSPFINCWFLHRVCLNGTLLFPKYHPLVLVAYSWRRRAVFRFPTLLKATKK